MAMIDYATTLNSLATARATATGANVTLIDESTAAINAKVSLHTPRWSTAVDTAKGAWITEATVVFTIAHAASNYAFTSAGVTPPTALSFNTYDVRPLAARLLSSKAGASDVVGHIVDVHYNAWSRVFNTGTEPSWKYTQGFQLASDPWAAPISVASIERDLYALIAKANTLLASLV